MAAGKAEESVAKKSTKSRVMARLFRRRRSPARGLPGNQRPSEMAREK